MFKNMRRNGQMLSDEETKNILLNATSGVLGLVLDNRYPYTVPLSYVYDGTRIIFHCAKSGYKLDALKNNNKVSFCVIYQDDVVPREYTTYYKSVIVFGRAHIIEDELKKREALELLGKRYCHCESGLNEEIHRQFDFLLMVEIEIDQMTGKQAIELVNSNKSSEK